MNPLAGTRESWRDQSPYPPRIHDLLRVADQHPAWSVRHALIAGNVARAFALRGNLGMMKPRRKQRERIEMRAHFDYRFVLLIEKPIDLC